MILSCWIDMLFRKQKTYIFWNKQIRNQITFSDSKVFREYFAIHDDLIDVYQQIPTNLILRRFWNSF